MSDTSILIQPYDDKILGTMRNRIVMSPMTRSFSPEHLATEDMAAYYERRAKDGVALIITEGVIIHHTGDGYVNVPHIETMEQAESWKKVVDRVHAAGGKIFCQLWHCGRISHSDFTGGVPPVSSTNVQAEGMNRQNNKPFGEPRALEESEMSEIVSMFETAAKNALEVGFDGVQLHFGHGYLIDQFLDGNINDRTDSYGGSVENRCRLALEIIEKLLSFVPTEKLMIRISPSRFYQDFINWQDANEILEHLLTKCDELGLRLLDISSAGADYDKTAGAFIAKARPMWPHTLIGGTSLALEKATEEIAAGNIDMVTYGRLILANPDFVHKITNNEELTPFSPEMREKLE